MLFSTFNKYDRPFFKGKRLDQEMHWFYDGFESIMRPYATYPFAAGVSEFTLDRLKDILYNCKSGLVDTYTTRPNLAKSFKFLAEGTECPRRAKIAAALFILLSPKNHCNLSIAEEERHAASLVELEAIVFLLHFIDTIPPEVQEYYGINKETLTKEKAHHLRFLGFLPE